VVPLKHMTPRGCMVESNL